MLRKLYDRTMALGAHRHAIWGAGAGRLHRKLGLPVPPDVLQIAMTLADRSRAGHYAADLFVLLLGGLLAVKYFA